MADNPIIDWLTDVNTCFLIGAGCSVCAGKPLIGDLSTRVVKKLTAPTTTLFSKLDGSHGRKATVEDLLNQLLQIKRLLSSRKDKEDGEWNLEKCEEAIRKTLQTIVEEIGGDWRTSPIHERFLKRLASHSSRKHCDIFSLNYDVVFEASLEALKIPYIDGFRGAENAYYDPSIFDEESKKVPLFRLFKLHGSVNWIREVDDTVRRRPYWKDDLGERQVIYPSEQKYFQSQYGVYEQLLNRFRDRLREDRPNNKLIVLGYSMLDDHITEAIVDAVLSPGSNLTVYAFVGPAADSKSQIDQFNGLVKRCNNRLNVMIGNHEFLGPALERTEWDSIKDKGMWKFENIVNLLAGGIA